MGDFIKHITLAKLLVQPDIALFKSLTFKQHDGIAAIIDEWNRRGMYHPVPIFFDTRALAYILATVYHETARTMQPIEEYADKDRNKDGTPDNFEKYDTLKSLGNTPEKDGDGTLYRGRGFVQITGKANYEKLEKMLHIPLLAHPELASNLLYATQILFEGMGQGLFTGRKLFDYINQERCDYKMARRIINGQDKAELIAEYANKFNKAINLSKTYLNGSETV